MARLAAPWTRSAPESQSVRRTRQTIIEPTCETQCEMRSAEAFESARYLTNVSETPPNNSLVVEYLNGERGMRTARSRSLCNSATSYVRPVCFICDAIAAFSPFQKMKLGRSLPESTRSTIEPSEKLSSRLLTIPLLGGTCPACASWESTEKEKGPTLLGLNTIADANITPMKSLKPEVLRSFLPVFSGFTGLNAFVTRFRATLQEERPLI